MKKLKDDFTKFLELIKTMEGSENGKTVKQMADIIFGEITKKTRQRIHSWMYEIRSDKYNWRIPIWSHRIPRSKQKLYYLSTTWRDFAETHNDLARRVELSIFHGLVHNGRAKKLGIDIKVTPKAKAKAIKKKIKKEV